MSAALLDVTVLIALLDRRHVHHEPAHGWVAGAQVQGWATPRFPRTVNHSGVDPSRLLEASQLTDTYLLALAVQRGVRLVGFDRHLSWDGVAGGREALWLIKGRGRSG